MLGWAVLIVAGLGLVWGGVGGYRHEDWLLSTFAGRGPVTRTVLPFAAVTGTAGVLVMVAANSVLDDRPTLSIVLLAVLFAGVFVMMPLVMMCAPAPSTAYAALWRDLQTSGLERGPATVWVVIMAPWALLMLGLYVFSALLIATTWG